MASSMWMSVVQDVSLGMLLRQSTIDELHKIYGDGIIINVG
jgi:hypothetical protein